jgi:hypothetical protein
MKEYIVRSCEACPFRKNVTQAKPMLAVFRNEQVCTLQHFELDLLADGAERMGWVDPRCPLREGVVQVRLKT